MGNVEKRAIPINFAQGLETKVDPKQIQLGRFLSLQNSVFTKAGLLAKRDGFAALPDLPDNSATEITTFGGNLTALGISSIQAYAAGSAGYVNKGTFNPLTFACVPVGRSPFNQTQCDSVVATNGYACTVYTEVNNGTAAYKYVIQDAETGQNIVAPTTIPGTVTGSPRVFLLGGYFVIVFTNVITAVSHLQYIAISVNNPTAVTAAADIASSYVSATTLSWDGYVVSDKLYIAYNTTSGGQQVKITYLNTSFIVASPQSFASRIATMMSVFADVTNPAAPIIYAAFYDSAGSTGYAVAVDQNLNQVMTSTQIISSGTYRNITCTAQNGVLTVVLEHDNAYAYDANTKSNYLQSVTVTKPATVTTGTVGSLTTFVRSVGLASKGFIYNSAMYMLAAYDGKTSNTAALQPTYFLVNLSGNVIAKFAYQNGGGYLTLGLPQAQIVGSSVYIAYLFKDLVQAVNKAQGVPASSVGIYTQTGVNLATMTFGADTLASAELGNNLNITGGLLYGYDGNTLSEQNFNLYPDMDLDLDGNGTSKSLAVSSTGGSIPATSAPFYYAVVYQWTDAQGMTHTSAPSVPVIAAAASFSGSTNSVTVSVPTLRLTYKSGVRIIIYRWSTTQQTYYQITSITAPVVNSTTSDVVTFVDTFTDAQIVGNAILYTTGGVLENTGTSAMTALTIFDTRAFGISAEDQNLLQFSKTVAEGVPVEMSDLLSIYVAPNTGATQNTGPMRCLAPMDDKLIIFKKNAIYYINGTGPDITGANSQYSQPIFITSTIGCVNQKSIVLTPYGLMFQTSGEIWLLGRDLDTKYIGAPVEAFSGSTVTSAFAIPDTNQIRFTMSSGMILMYDYFYNQWGTFVGAPAISSTIFQDKHTLLNSSGQISQETPGVYLDRGVPVNMQFTTGWINLAGLQGYIRAFFFYILGEYITPHKLALSIAYDYNAAATQLTVISPTNFSPNFGNQDGNYGDGVDQGFGGEGTLEQWRIFLDRQRCQAFQISMQESYDPSFGVAAGAGLTLSGLNLVVGMKKGFRPISSAQSTGGQS
jgi:hypothetical protein